MKTNQQPLDKFNFFIPLELEKGTEESGGLVKISGVASTEAKDDDGETLIPAGFDFAPLLQSGFLNWNHQARTTSKAICGEPTSARIQNNGKEFFIEGVIYPNDEGNNVIKLAETLEKHSPNRRLGFSIEGQAIERDILNPKKVLRAKITGVAITQCPKNPNTLMNIVKGEYDSEFIKEDESSNIIEQFNSIVSSLFNSQIMLEHCHRKTKNEPIHEALGEAYSNLADLKDSIIEQLIGSIGAQYDNLILSSILGYNSSMNQTAADQVCLIAKQIEQFANTNGYSSVENLAQEVYGIGAKLKYKLSLKQEVDQSPLDKSMMVNIDINPPSIEGADKEKKLLNDLKKSEIYNQIYNRYTNSFEKAEQIYNFINIVNEKSMKTDNITPDTLNKAFALLDESISLEKGNNQKTLDDYDKKDDILLKDDDNDKNVEKSKNDNSDDDDSIKKGDSEDEDDDDDFEKAMNCEGIAKSFLEKGMSEDEVVKAMTSVGISTKLAETSCSNCIAQANAEKDGGNITTLSKGNEDEFSKEDEPSQAILKALDSKFGALGAILKAQSSQIQELTKSHAEVQGELEKIKNIPEGRKSVTSSRVLERFEKSADGKVQTEVYDSRNVSDMNALSNRLFGEYELIKSNGGDDRSLEKAVSDLEISKTTNFAAISPRLKSLGIEVR